MKKNSSNLIMALSAVLVSLATLFVYLYQARIMQKQQHSAVWPYIESIKSYPGDSHYITVTNKGIGPALVKRVSVFVNNEEVEGQLEDEKLLNLLKQLLQEEPASWSYSSVNNRVIAPGEAINIYQLYDSVQAARMNEALQKNSVRIEVCYCSIFEDCWISKGLIVEEGDCD